MKTRYKLYRDEVMVHESSSILGVAKYIGCSHRHIYKYMVDYKFTYKKVPYTIYDKLS
jgi:hypothetical protein